MKLARDFRKQARDALRGRWGIAILAMIIAALLGALGNISGAVSRAGDTSVEPYQYLSEHGWEWVSDIRVPISGAVATFLSIYSVIVFIIGSGILLGYDLFNLDLIRGRETGVARLFDRMSIFGRALALRLVSSIFITLWSLLFIIPGIVAAYRYALAPYLMAENPEMGCMDALNESKRLMEGNKGRMFCLHMSFIGWYLLGFVTAGIGTLFVAPYANAADAAFYEEIAHGSKA